MRQKLPPTLPLDKIYQVSIFCPACERGIKFREYVLSGREVSSSLGLCLECGGKTIIKVKKEKI